MSQAIRIARTGGPEVMELVEEEVGAPGPGQVRLRQHAIGLNYSDVYFRGGLYPSPLPGGLGIEGAGVVQAVGEGVTQFRPGERVAYALRPPGAYAQERIVPADILVRLPDDIDFETAAAGLLKGLTVHYLFHSTFALKGGETILFHAAAGGVGLLACQWARALGVTMIGTVSSEAKAELARAHGCAHTINYKSENVVERVRALTGGRGVPVVYDGIGRATFETSLDCLAPLGMLVAFGTASGVPPPFGLNELARRGSLFVTRPMLADYAAAPGALAEMAEDFFRRVRAGQLRIEARQRYALADAARAHRDLEAGHTSGASILIP